VNALAIAAERSDRLSRAVSAIWKANAAVDEFYDDPITDYYGVGGEMSPLVQAHADRERDEVLERLGLTYDDVYAAVVARCGKKFAARIGLYEVQS